MLYLLLARAARANWRQKSLRAIWACLSSNKNALAQKCACMERGPRLQMARNCWSWGEFRQLAPFMFDNQLSSYFPLYCTRVITQRTDNEHNTFHLLKVAWRTMFNEIERNTSSPPISLLTFCCFSSCFNLFLAYYIWNLEQFKMYTKNFKSNGICGSDLLGLTKAVQRCCMCQKKLRSKEHIT